MTTENTKMYAFRNTSVTKEALLIQLRAHYAADEIIKGHYWENGTGCAVGCAVHTSDDPHAEYEPRFGIPQMLAQLEDGIFESLPNGRAKEWPIQFIEAIPVGADLSQVGSQFLHWLLVDPEDGIIKFADERGKVAIQAVADLYARQLQGETISIEDWNAAADAAARIKQAEKLLSLLRNAPVVEVTQESVASE
jgi:hypothetical protein